MPEKPLWWERFRQKMDVLDKCWNWTGHLGRGGYGIFWLDGKNKRAHRVIWEHINGPVPDNLQVCHTCDNAKCVNPNHLFLGTALDNQHDSISKGRKAFGERCNRRVFTEEEVREILTSKETHTALAAKYGVMREYISQIKRGQHWRHLNHLSFRRRRGRPVGYKKGVNF
jgi:hypothetical protein